MKEYFSVSAKQYDPARDFSVVRPASLDHPKDNAVMFLMGDRIAQWEALCTVRDCIVFWPEGTEIPAPLAERHLLIPCADPRQRFALFFRENGITNHPPQHDWNLVNGAYICTGAVIGEGTAVFPGAYIGPEVTIGKRCYIGSGVRLIGEVSIGDDVVIHENTVIGSDGLTICRDEDGKVATTPQFGGVVIEDNVLIGALTVIARGAIDNTVIHTGSRIDNSVFISHNVQLGEDTLVVGESILFGSSSTGKQAFLSGNCTIRNGMSVGARAVVGMGAVVVRPVPDGAVVKGNPAK